MDKKKLLNKAYSGKISSDEEDKKKKKIIIIHFKKINKKIIKRIIFQKITILNQTKIMGLQKKNHY